MIAFILALGIFMASIALDEANLIHWGYACSCSTVALMVGVISLFKGK